MNDDKHGDLLVALAAVQEAESDQRDAVREAQLFVHKRDGQWEPYWWNANRGRPRYTFDQAGPIVDQVAGALEEADFDIRITPSSGAADKDDAQLMDGMVRNIENVSDAKDIYQRAARMAVCGGLDGWEVQQQYVDDDCFDQDLAVTAIANYVDSVWFGPHKKPDASDAQWCVKLEAVERRDYDRRYPEGSGQSIGDNRLADAYYNKEDQVVIGQLFWVEETDRELLQMSTGRVLEATPEVMSVLDELAVAGETVTATRKRPKRTVHSRLFDGSDWLKPKQKTVFSSIPIVPIMCNFNIIENKLVYYGVVEKLLDPCRVYNYTKSREIEEGALSPREKYWATEAQTAGHEDTLATLNTNADPVQHYNVDPVAPVNPPPLQGGAKVNPGLATSGESMRQLVQQSAGLYAASMGDNPGLQSGVAIDKLLQRGGLGTSKYFRAVERAIRRTARILLDAMPVVYSETRQMRIMREDGSFEMTVLNEPVLDQQTMRLVTINDISKGKYDAVVQAGPSYQSQQDETVKAITEVAKVNPQVMQTGADVLLNNINAPGMDIISQRVRQQLLKAGMIPEDQMTEEELAKLRAAEQQLAQQPPPPDPAMVLAQAEVGKAEAQTNKVRVDAQIAQSREQRENYKAEQEAQQAQFNQMMQLQAQQIEQTTAVLEAINLQAETLKTIREAAGVDAVVGPQVTQAYIKQADNLNREL